MKGGPPIRVRDWATEREAGCPIEGTHAHNKGRTTAALLVACLWIEGECYKITLSGCVPPITKPPSLAGCPSWSHP